MACCQSPSESPAGAAIRLRCCAASRCETPGSSNTAAGANGGAFALWGIVQIAPGLPGNAVLNDVVIVLFVVDLAILVSPLDLSEVRENEPCG